MRTTTTLLLTAILLSVIAGAAALCAAPRISTRKAQPARVVNDCIKNGDFGDVGDGQAASWKFSGAVKPERVSGVWQTLSGKFKSGERTSANFLFFMYQGGMGSVWIDNVRFSPEAGIKDGGFESLNPDGSLAECKTSHWNTAVFSDSARASQGSRSLRMTHEHEAVPESQMRQFVGLEPNTDYTFSFDVFVGDDFQGEALGCVEGISDYLAVSTLMENRDRCGQYALALDPTQAAPAGVSQQVDVKPGMNLQASVDVNHRAFPGATKLVIEDAASGRVLAESGISGVNPKWQSVQVSFQSISPKLRVRVVAEGEGSLLVDNVEITPPRITPPLQQVQWLPAAQNFRIPAKLQVSVQGRAGKAIEGGLELLSRDLGRHNVSVTTTKSQAAPLKILIGSGYAVKGKGNESYSLAVTSKGITIKAVAEAGAFYGLMTLLQLIDSRAGKPVLLACKVTDYPDMPLRGSLYADAEQSARWKLNTVMESTGYPVTATEKKAMWDMVRKYEKLNLKIIPYSLSMMGGYYVQKINPNLAAGVLVINEKVTLNGDKPTPLANPYVIRTKLSDVKLSSHEKLSSVNDVQEYELGKDYRVIDGDMAYNYNLDNPKPFSVVRLPGSSIPDGATVYAEYDWVSHYRESDGRTEVHISYVPVEPQTRKLMDDFLTGFAKEFPFPYICPANCLHEFGPNDAQLRTDSRVLNSGRYPVELFAEDTRFQSAAVKRGNPKAKVMFWAGTMTNPYVRQAEPFLPRDGHVTVWGYDANWPAVYGREAIEYWSKLGIESSVMSWDNLRNARGWAQVVAEARRKGYPCLGIIATCWANRTGGLRESAAVSWRVPQKGEKNYVSVP